MIKSIEANPRTTAHLPMLARVCAGLAMVLLLSILAWWMTQQVYKVQLPFGIPGKVLEFPLWGAVAGLIGNALLRLTGQRELVRPGIRTELFLKIGLVLLGAGINLKLIISTAGGAILQTLILITS